METLLDIAILLPDLLVAIMSRNLPVVQKFGYKHSENIECYMWRVFDMNMENKNIKLENFRLREVGVFLIAAYYGNTSYLLATIRLVIYRG